MFYKNNYILSSVLRIASVTNIKGNEAGNVMNPFFFAIHIISEIILKNQLFYIEKFTWIVFD